MVINLTMIFKKIFRYSVFLSLFLFFIGIMGFGAILKYHYEGGKKFQFLQKSVITISSVPFNIKQMIVKKDFKIDKPPILFKHKNKKRFESYIPNTRNALLVLPRYDHNISRSVVDIIDLNNFETIHSYKHDIDAMNNQVKNLLEYPKLKINDASYRFEYRHPLLLSDGSLISDSEYSVEFKIDFCSKLLWINDEERFHHSKMLDHEGNIWLGGQMNPKSKYVKEFPTKTSDDSIIKMNTDGVILYNKSVSEILIENKIFDLNHSENNLDPIHLNDIEPAFNNTKYWLQGDLFISIRGQSAIIHYRPNTNKVINYLSGPFSQQHDVDIISEKEISIFNNNNFLIDNDYSEVLIYNFETKEFRKLFNEQLQKENIKTISQGLSHIFKDGALMIEEQNHGRIILFNKKGKKEWEFVNKDENDDIGFVSWSRVIEDEIFIEKFKSLIKNNKCLK